MKIPVICVNVHIDELITTWRLCSFPKNFELYTVTIVIGSVERLTICITDVASSNLGKIDDNTKKRILEKFSPKVIAKKFIKIYSDLTLD